MLVQCVVLVLLALTESHAEVLGTSITGPLVQPLLGGGNVITDVTQYPYLLLVRQLQDYNIAGSATLLRPTWAISTADILKYTDQDLVVQSGTTDVQSPYNGQLHYVRQINYHPDHGFDSQPHDVAVLKLCPSVKSVTSFPVLPAQGEEVTGLSGFVLGYSGALDSQLKYDNVVVDTDANCATTANAFYTFVPVYNLCTVNDKQHIVCVIQDNSVPLLTSSGKLLGVAHIASGCGTTQGMTFTDISQYVDWINGYIN